MTLATQHNLEELGQDSIWLGIHEIQPSPENDLLYRPVDPNDPEIVALAASIAAHGVLEPIVVSLDGRIISGHRRHAAAKVAGLEAVPCRIEPVDSRDDPDGFLILLREHNRQRDKSADEKLREELLAVDPHQAYQSLIDHRAAASAVKAPSINISGSKTRAKISAAKMPMLNAILQVLADNREFGAMSVRQIHYRLLNDAPLRHAGKHGSRYKNDQASYKSLVELTTRARLDGSIKMDAIADETRPVSVWDVDRDVRGYARDEFDGFLKGYWRDLMQSQPNHVEILAEKNTLASILRPVAMEFRIPMTIGRGFCSLPPRHDMAQRFWASGKEKLVLLIVSDFDPDGEEIAHAFARSMRDDFDVENVHPIKVALTAEQVEQYELPPNMVAKESSTNHAKFVAKYGANVFEVEALPPATLQNILRETIDSVLDVDAFNAELDAERNDAAFLEGVRNTVHASMKGINLAGMDGERDV